MRQLSCQKMPPLPVDATRSYGAEVVLYDRYSESREAIGEALTKERGAILVKPMMMSCDLWPSTIGIEIADQIAEQGVSPAALYCCAGGGGLIAGLSLAVHESHPALSIYSAEPENFDDIARSLEAGTICHNDPSSRSICDAIITPAPGNITFPIMQRHLAGGVSVSDDDCLRAMQSCWRHLKLVVEPGSGCGICACVKGR